MDSKKVLTIQHWEEVGPGGVLRLFGVVEEDVHTLMVLLSHSCIKILDQLLDSAQLEKLIDCIEHNPSVQASE